MSEIVKVTEIQMTCHACPSQWSGKTNDGKEVYVRYRWGYLSVRLNNEEIFGKRVGENVTEESTIETYKNSGLAPDVIEKMIESERNMRKMLADMGQDYFSYDGSMDYEALKMHTLGVVEWPDHENADGADEIEELQYKALNELTEQAQELDMGYEKDKEANP